MPIHENGNAHNIPESASALWRIVSFTAAKTSRMLDVSVACVRLEGVVLAQLVFFQMDMTTIGKRTY